MYRAPVARVLLFALFGITVLALLWVKAKSDGNGYSGTFTELVAGRVPLLTVQFEAVSGTQATAIARTQSNLTDPVLHASLRGPTTVLGCAVVPTTQGSWLVNCTPRENGVHMLRVKLLYASRTEALRASPSASLLQPNMLSDEASVSFEVQGVQSGLTAGGWWVKRAASRAVEAKWVRQRQTKCAADTMQWQWESPGYRMSYGHVDNCLQNWDVLVVGDSVSMQWVDYLRDVLPGNHLRPLKVKKPLGLALPALLQQIAAETPGNRSAVLVNTGLWDAAYGEVSETYGTMLTQVFRALAAAGFTRILWRTTTAVHPHTLPSLLPKHRQFTNPRVERLNQLATGALTRAGTRIDVLDGYMPVSYTHLTLPTKRIV
eukprot:TRINITY_DN1140_c0_g1_i4.p1 TRINITY_DN1140_c0_g1~~TRINITY_DN1140_c0_g1_i4.p1  ORF type:complete len:375 (+),score=51.39 TRINITY_DN1140_c0_g1_i4:93-1217(+)